MIVAILELIASGVCLWLIGKKVFYYFHFDREDLSLTVIYSVIYALVIYSVRDSYIGKEALHKFIQGDYSVLLYLVIYSVIISFSEELIFRLYLSQRFNMLASAVLFTALHWRPHFPYPMFIVLFLFAMVQWSLLKKSKSLWPVMITHLVATYVMILVYR